MHTALRLVLGLSVLSSAACTKDQPPSSATPAPTTTTAPAPGAMSRTAPSPADDGSVSGTVLETMDAGGYTYAKLDRGGAQVWVAGPETKLAVGTQIGKVSGTLMTGFRSTTLDRTFDQIYFITTFGAPGAAASGDPHAGVAKPAEPPPAAVEKLAPITGGKTIAQVFAGKAALSGKPVVIRGKVVKVNNGIMGRNWLHVQDGTGGAGTNDLVVTTDATVARGDVVVVRGTLATDKDFGGGYAYDAIIENATVGAK